MPLPKYQFHAPAAVLFLVTAVSMNIGAPWLSHAWVPPPPLPARISPKQPQTATPKSSSLSAKRSKGFGAATATGKSSTKTKKGGLGGVTVATSSKTESILNSSHPLVSESKKSIQEVLNPRYSDPTVLEDIKARLRAGQVVILKDAFVPELADAMHAVLKASTEGVNNNNNDNNNRWDHNEDYFGDGYHFRHYNIYNPQDFPTLCKDMQSNIFESDATKEFMTELTGRDCNSQEVSAAPSYYGSGDHSLPHTDHIGQRSVAFVWHLSQNWRPEWGGALYWAPEPLANAVHHASYNSLVLFSVTPHSAHFVTTVSPHAQEKRLAYNGWWHSDWVPSAADPLEDMLGTPEQRLTLTHAQIMAIQDMLDDPWAPRIQPPERQAEIEALRGKIMEELYPPALASVSPP